jgi:GGDEF domain-containing protein
MRILDAFVAPVPGLEHAPVVGIGASIGVAVANCDRIPDAIARADAAMYAAKQAGGTRVLVDGDPVPAPDPARADAAARRTR